MWEGPTDAILHSCLATMMHEILSLKYLCVNVVIPFCFFGIHSTWSLVSWRNKLCWKLYKSKTSWFLDQICSISMSYMPDFHVRNIFNVIFSILHWEWPFNIQYPNVFKPLKVVWMLFMEKLLRGLDMNTIYLSFRHFMVIALLWSLLSSGSTIHHLVKEQTFLDAAEMCTQGRTFQPPSVLSLLHYFTKFLN